jgi:hypothetical protein
MLEANNPTIEVFKEKHVDDVAGLIQRSFFELNTIWRSNKS